MRKVKVVFFLLAFVVIQVYGKEPGVLLSRSGISAADEVSFYAETKQVNQFIRRFNGEEDVRGVKLATNDPTYHSSDLRKKYLNMLFDHSNSDIPELLKNAFVNDMVVDRDPKFLDFHGGDWFSEIEVLFQRGNEMVIFTLFMKLVKENLGSKWIINDVYSPPYENLYKPNGTSTSRFLHPLSHELDFMNLDKVFDSQEYIGDYFFQGFQVDKLSIFLYEIRTNKLRFKQVTNVKFHFFQLKNWYMEISEFNRPGLNKGWLISNLIRLEDGQKDRIIDFIHHRE